MREYAVIFGQTRTGWSAHAPDLPGLGVTGSTFAEVEKLVREGIEFHLEGMLEDGDPIPEATTRVGTVKTDIVERQTLHFAKSA